MWRVTVSEMALTYCYQTEERTVLHPRVAHSPVLIHTICQDEKPGAVEKLTVYFKQMCFANTGLLSLYHIHAIFCL